jgi:hypothetical protein
VTEYLALLPQAAADDGRNLRAQSAGPFEEKEALKSSNETLTANLPPAWKPSTGNLSDSCASSAGRRPSDLLALRRTVALWKRSLRAAGQEKEGLGAAAGTQKMRDRGLCA